MMYEIKLFYIQKKIPENKRVRKTHSASVLNSKRISNIKL